MEYAADLFSSYWWLLFPLGFFVAQGWSSFMRYKRAKAKIELLKSYADAGKEPPAELMATLDSDRHGAGDWHGDGESGRGSGAGGSVFVIILFTGLSAVFAFVGHEGWLGDDKPMYFVAMILGVLALAFLFSAIFGRRRNRD